MNVAVDILPERAAVTNAGLKVLSSALNFLLVPLYLRVYDVTTYGEISLLLSLAQYLSVLDLGLTGALVQECVRLRSLGDQSYFRLRRLAVVFLIGVGGLATAAA